MNRKSKTVIKNITVVWQTFIFLCFWDFFLDVCYLVQYTHIDFICIFILLVFFFCIFFYFFNILSVNKWKHIIEYRIKKVIKQIRTKLNIWTANLLDTKLNIISWMIYANLLQSLKFSCPKESEGNFTRFPLTPQKIV